MGVALIDGPDAAAGHCWALLATSELCWALLGAAAWLHACCLACTSLLDCLPLPLARLQWPCWHSSACPSQAPCLPTSPP